MFLGSFFYDTVKKNVLKPQNNKKWHTEINSTLKYDIWKNKNTRNFPKKIKINKGRAKLSKGLTMQKYFQVLAKLCIKTC